MIIIETCFYAGLAGWAVIRAKNQGEISKLTAFGYCVGLAGLALAIGTGLV